MQASHDTSPRRPAAHEIGKTVLGETVDDQTRCVHYRGETDIVALQFKCCGDFYPCFACHETAADHPIERWNAHDLAERAVLCGACGHRLSIAEYTGTGTSATNADGPAEHCPKCAARFNPGCRLHHDLYFDFPRSTDMPAD